MKTKLPKKTNIFSKLQISRDWISPYSNFTSNQKNFTQEQKTQIVIEGQSTDKNIGAFCVEKGITPSMFYQWSQEFLTSHKQKVAPEKKQLSQDERFSIVIEGQSGQTTVAEICKREQISHDTFLAWSREFLEVRRKQTRTFRKNLFDYTKNKLFFQENKKEAAFDFLDNYFDFTSKNLLIATRSETLFIEDLPQVNEIVCLQRINDIRHINKFFEQVNSKLPTGGMFAGCLETFTARRERKKINKMPIVRDIYFFSEFVFKRIIPKLSFTKGLYFDITKGNDRLLSKAEGLGRLVSCGFKIIDFKSIDGLLYFVVKKEKEPDFNQNPSYGPIYKMPRIGKDGKTIKVYKLRTMHPYSEYLQDYVLRVNGYAKTGKPADDFRIPAWGKVMRKYWLDELPQLINVVKGEMKLVGVRPVSERYFKDIPKEMQKLRLTQKPGCIPPYVALNRKSSVMDVLRAEKEYLEEKIKNPYTTDIKFFFRAIYNIVVKHKRSA